MVDVQQLDAKHRKKLVELAEAVWRAEAPVDWIARDAEPDSLLRALDEWLLKLSGSNVSAQSLYDDIRAACQARIAVARDKQQRTKKQQEDSVGSVADSIVQLIEPRLKMRNFPDDFVAGAPLDIPFVFDRNSLREIEISHLLDSYDVEIRGNGKVAYSGTHTKPVAEAIVRALLLGRSTFSVSEDREVMDRAVNEFLKWVAATDKAINEAISESALGTGYEELLKKEVYQRLGIHSATGMAVLPRRISL